MSTDLIIVPPPRGRKERLLGLIPFQGLLRQRWQILFLIRKEFFASNRNSIFSTFWSLAIPLVPITAYIILRSVVSGSAGEDGIHPMVYVTLGVTLWMLFKDMVVIPVQSVTRYSNTIAQTELSIGGAILVGFGGILVATALRLALCIPVVLLTTDLTMSDLPTTGMYLGVGILFFFSFGLMSVPLTALFPDLRNIYNTIFSYLIFFSLAIFPFSNDTRLTSVIRYNPFAVFIDSTRMALLNGEVPMHDIGKWLIYATPALLLFAMFIIQRTHMRLKEAFL